MDELIDKVLQLIGSENYRTYSCEYESHVLVVNLKLTHAESKTAEIFGIRKFYYKYSKRQNHYNPWIGVTSAPHLHRIRVAFVLFLSYPWNICVVFMPPVSKPCQTLSKFVSNARRRSFVRLGQHVPVLHPYGVRAVRVVSVSWMIFVIHVRVCEFAQGYAADVIRIWQGQHGCSLDTTQMRYGFDTVKPV